jgi:hypothetical protein
MVFPKGTIIKHFFLFVIKMQKQIQFSLHVQFLPRRMDSRMVAEPFSRAHAQCWACTLPPLYMGTGYHTRAQRAWVQTACLDLFFTSYRLKHLVWTQHFLENIFQNPMQVPRYFILIQYILSWVKYNSKYHKGEITF